MFVVISFLLTIFFLLGTFFLTALASAFRRIHKRDSKKQIIAAGKVFFYRSFHVKVFSNDEYEGVFFATICAQNIARCCYIGFGVLFLLATPLFEHHPGELAIPSLSPYDYDFSIFWIILSILTFLLISFFFGEYLPRILGMKFPEKVFRISTPFASIFMFIAFPITFLFLKISQSFSSTIYLDYLHEPDSQAKQEIMDIIHEAQLSPGINNHDKKLIGAVLSFRERIAREVMVPRVNIFSLPETTTIKDAATQIAPEGFSRIPIYRSTVDEIVGLLMYKDILAKFREYEEKKDPAILLAPIETIQKKVLHTPETKKISSLLQEFRKKQMHLAIVVDEYGGTEGIITIEDILEEIVGDIADEYDEEEALFVRQPDGSLIIDASMSIFDAEEMLNISIPQEGDYDTLGGYVFHCASAIPSKGFIIHQEEFELEVLDSNERVVDKVRIKALRKREKEFNDNANDDE